MMIYVLCYLKDILDCPTDLIIRVLSQIGIFPGIFLVISQEFLWFLIMILEGFFDNQTKEPLWPNLKSYFSLLTKPMKTNGENGTTENETETKTESEPLKSEEKPTHSSKTEPTHSPTTQASLLASMAEAQNGLENKSNLISETIKNFGLDRFTGRF